MATVASSSFVQFFVSLQTPYTRGLSSLFFCSFRILINLCCIKYFKIHIFSTPIPFIPRSETNKIFKMLFSQLALICSNALFLSKLRASIIFLISLMKFNSLNSKICCSLSSVSSHTAYNLTLYIPIGFKRQMVSIIPQSVKYSSC